MNIIEDKVENLHLNKKSTMSSKDKQFLVNLHNLYLALRYSEQDLPVKQEVLLLKGEFGTTSLNKIYRAIVNQFESFSVMQKVQVEHKWNKEFGDGDFKSTYNKISTLISERNKNKSSSSKTIGTGNLSPGEEVLKPDPKPVVKPVVLNESIKQKLQDRVSVIIPSGSSNEFESDNDSVVYGNTDSPKPSSPLPCPDPEDEEHCKRNFENAMGFSRQPINRPRLHETRKIVYGKRSNFRNMEKYCEQRPPLPSNCNIVSVDKELGDDSLWQLYRNRNPNQWYRCKAIPNSNNLEVYHPVSPISNNNNPRPSLMQFNIDKYGKTNILENPTYEDLEKIKEIQPDTSLVGGRRFRDEEQKQNHLANVANVEFADRIATDNLRAGMLVNAINVNIQPFSGHIVDMYRRSVHIGADNQVSFYGMIFNWYPLPSAGEPHQQFLFHTIGLQNFVNRVINLPISTWQFYALLVDTHPDGTMDDHHIGTRMNNNFQTVVGDMMKNIKKAFENYREENLSILQWEVRVVPEGGIIVGGRVIEQANLARHLEQKMGELKDNWYLINPSSKTNCLWTSASIIDGYIKNPKLLKIAKVQNGSGGRLKKRIGTRNRSGGINEDIQNLANYKNKVVQVWNINNQIQRSFVPENEEDEDETMPDGTLNILISNGHYHAMIPKDCPVATEHYSVPEAVVDKIKEIRPLEKNFKEKLIVTYDIETYRSPLDDEEKMVDQIGYAISWCFQCESEEIAEEAEELGYTIHRYEWTKLDQQVVQMVVAVKEEIGNVADETGDCDDCCLDRALDQWMTHSFFNNSVFYAHNGGKFDIRIIMGQSKLLSNEDYVIDPNRTIELNGRIINMQVANREVTYEVSRKIGKRMANVTVEHTIQLKDSFPLFGPGSSLAKLGKELNTHHRKLEEQINVHALQYKDTWRANWHQHDLSKYLLHDVLTLLEVLIQFNDIVKQQTGIPITAVNTGASLAKKYYLSSFYMQGICRIKVFSLTADLDLFVREGYGGGRCENFYHGEYNGPCYYYDFTSLYPDVGRLNLPTNKPYFYSDPAILQDRWKDRVTAIRFRDVRVSTGFWKVKVTSPLAAQGNPMNSDRYKPLFGIKENGMYVFRWFTEPTEMVLFEEEIIYAIRLKLDYSFELISVLEFSYEPLLKEAMETMFKNKQEADAQGKKGLAKTWKILVNSLYGVWGLKTLDREGIQISRPETSSWCVDLAQNRLMDLSKQGNYLVTRRLHDLEVTDCNVAVAAAVTSHARMKLYSLFMDITAKGGKILYCDTDSVITSYHIEGDIALKNKWMLDSNGRTLGKDLGKLKNEIVECYEKVPSLTPQDNFSHVVIVAPKLYYIKGDDDRIYKKAHKGYAENPENNDIVTYERLKTLVDLSLPISERKMCQHTIQWQGGNAQLIKGNIGVRNIKRFKVLRPKVRKGNLEGTKVIPYNNEQEMLDRLEELKQQEM